VKVRESDYLDRAFEEKAHGQTHSIEFERQVAQEYLGGETLHGLAKRHDISRDLIRIWVAKYKAGSFDSDVAVANIQAD
jgi:transposase